MEAIEKLMNALESVGVPVKYAEYRENIPLPYIVWSEYGEEYERADNRILSEIIQVQVDYYTEKQLDDNANVLKYALDEAGIPFEKSVLIDNDERIFHHVYDCEVRQASSKPEPTPPTPIISIEQGYGVVSDCLTYPISMVDEGIIGEANDVALTGYAPEGMPYTDGLIQWFDFSSYAGEETIENPCYDGTESYNGGDYLTIIGGTAGNNELVLQGTASSYASCKASYEKNSFTFYLIFKSDNYVSSWNGILGNAEAASSGKSLKIASQSGYITLDRYSGNVQSTVSVQEYNVVSVVGSNDSLFLYINGILIDSVASYSIGNLITFGCNNNNGELTEYYSNPLRFKMFAAFNTAQTSEQIAANSEWLTEKFLSEVN